MNAVQTVLKRERNEFVLEDGGLGVEREMVVSCRHRSRPQGKRTGGELVVN